MAANDDNMTPSYWSIDRETFDAWVRVLGTTGAAKLIAACAGYFFHGFDPDTYKLNKTARALFEGERARLDRRRTSALNGSGRGRKAREAGTVDVENPGAEIVEKSGRDAKTDGKPRGNRRRTNGKPTENRASAPAPTCEINNSRSEPIVSRNRNLNPQTPTAPTGADGGGGGAGSVTPQEFAELAASLGFTSPTAYGGLLRAV